MVGVWGDAQREYYEWNQYSAIKVIIQGTIYAATLFTHISDTLCSMYRRSRSVVCGNTCKLSLRHHGRNSFVFGGWKSRLNWL
jgi:hypothetical protein